MARVAVTMDSPGTRKVRMLGFFWQHYRSHVFGVLAAAVATAVGATAEGLTLLLIVPLAESAVEGSESLVDQVGPFSLDQGTGTILIVIVGLLVGSVVFRILALWLRARTVQAWQRSEELRAVRVLVDADYEHVARRSPAELQAVVTTNLQHAADGLNIIVRVMNAAISFLIVTGLAFLTAPLTAAVMAAIGVLLLAVMRPVSRATRRSAEAESSLAIESGRLVNDSARDGREIRLYGAQEKILERFRGLTFQLARVKQRTKFSQGLGPIVYQGVGLLFVVLAIALVLNVATFEVAALGTVALLFLRALSYGQQVSGAQQDYAMMVPYAERLDEELDAMAAAEETFGDGPLDRVEQIVVQHASYRYPGSSDAEDALREVELELTPPGVVGLVGQSGSGKSTLSQLLLRLRKPTHGQILVNDRPIGTFSRDSWVRQVALVPQQPQLVRGSFRDNIVFFRDGILDEEVERVVFEVGLNETFDALPDGLDTELGETSRELSGGQLQRLGIARALIGSPSLLVLDEPTSALDAESEEWVQRAIREVGRSSLVVIISHRATTLEVCDRIVRLHHGRVVDDSPVRGTRSPEATLGLEGS